MIHFYVPCLPAGMPRVKATQRGKHAAVYTPMTVGPKGNRRPHPAVECKSQIRAAFAEAYHGSPLLGPVRVDWVAIFPRADRLVWKKKPMVRLPHEGKPDRDNLDKTILDALKDLAWRDDAQVCSGYMAKLIASGNEPIGIYVRIVPVDPNGSPDCQVVAITSAVPKLGESALLGSELISQADASKSPCRGEEPHSAPAIGQSHGASSPGDADP